MLEEFELKETREFVLPEDRKTKKRDPPKHQYICRFKDCGVRVIDIRKHCRQQHKLTGNRLKKYQGNAWPVLISQEMSTEDESEIDSSEEEEEEKQARGAVSQKVSILDMEFVESDDPDFLAEDYVQNCTVNGKTNSGDITDSESDKENDSPSSGEWAGSQNF